ncbi:MAG: ABC transporter permease [Acidobacteria bacterium]|nr:ABC transporter permease [Acidobacteriota bacterium]
METLWQDLKYGIRTILKKPAFTIVAIFTLAMGIGANTAIFSVINAVFLKPLPYKDADKLVVIWEKLIRVDQVELSPDGFFAYKTRSRAFEQIAAGERMNFNLTGDDEPVRLEAYAVTANLFSTLGLSPVLGRTFTEEEDRTNVRVAVMSYNLWQNRFGRVADIIGRSVSLNGRDYTVVGVMPREFQFPPRLADLSPSQSEIYVPRSLETEKNRNSHNLLTIGRIKSDVTFEQARAELENIARLNEQESSQIRGGGGVNPVLLQSAAGRRLKQSLTVLAGAVGFVLLIACANIANLLLASAASRQKEFAIRLSLGAKRGRIVRQLLTESFLLSLFGGGLGLLLAVWIGDAISVLGAMQIPRADQIAIDGRVLGFTLLLTLITGVVFGLAPAMQASQPDLNESLKDGGRGVKGAGRHRLRNALVIVEVALSLILLIGAGLLIKSFWRLQQVDPGFDPQNLLSLEITLPESKYSEQPRRSSFYQQALEKISALPGVKAAAVVNHPPFSGRRGVNVFRIEGRPKPESMANTPLADYRVISPDYLQMIGIPILQGRGFTESDGEDSTRVAMINQAFADRYWPNENPIGRRISGGGDEWMTIIGVAGNVKQSGLDAESAPHVYVSYLQLPLARTGLLVRTASDPLRFVAAVRSQIQSIDRDQPIYNIHRMTDLISESVSGRRLNLLLLGTFALVALVLASVGIYGVISYSVTQRTHEIGIRMALGAQARDVLKMIVSQGMALVLAGIAIGIAGAFAVTRLMSGLLFGVSPSDLSTFATISLLLAVVALLACYVPARKATRVDPLVALRYE